MDGRTEVVAAPAAMAPLPPNPTHPAVRFELVCPDGRADWAPALIVSEVTPAVTFKQTREFVRARAPTPPTLPAARPSIISVLHVGLAPLWGGLWRGGCSRMRRRSRIAQGLGCSTAEWD